jgi:hypothetical protein
MKYRKLRIAWSVMWGVVAVLLVAIWLDSYLACRYIDTRYYRLQMMAATLRGSLGLDINTNQTSSGPGTGPKTYWRFESFPSKKRDYGLVTDKLRVYSFLGIRWVSVTNYYEMDLPFWLPTMAVVVALSAPWIRWSKRFSLRTLLIVTTLVAVLLGLIVYLARK